MSHFLDRLTCLFDQRHAELVEPLFLGQLLDQTEQLLTLRAHDFSVRGR